jgi:hypothetical protein
VGWRWRRRRAEDGGWRRSCAGRQASASVSLSVLASIELGVAASGKEEQATERLRRHGGPGGGSGCGRRRGGAGGRGGAGAAGPQEGGAVMEGDRRRARVSSALQSV